MKEERGKKSKDKHKKDKEDKSHDDDSGTTDENVGNLFVNIIKAKDLPPGGSKSVDAYCTISCSSSKKKYKTVVIKKSLSPIWNEEFRFHLPNIKGHLFIKVWNKDRWKNDNILGEICVHLDQLKEQNEIKGWFPLEGGEKEKEKEKDKEKKKKNIGQLKIRVYNKGKGDNNNDDSPNIRNVYEIGEEIGRGGFSVVYEGVKKENGEKFAIKCIAKNQGSDEIDVLKREIDVMKRLKHKNIIQLYDVFNEEENIYLVIELVTGGELFDHIIDRGNYSEKDAATIIRQVLEAVAFMHNNGIAHRDLKPENILVTGPNNDIIKVSDFGLSKDFEKDKLRSAVGTPDYVAPEVLGGTTYDNSVDIWSIGVITYILLCGFPPFYGNTDQEIFAKILKVDYDFPSPDWDTISEDAKIFIRAVLTSNFRDRPTAEQCLEAPWIVDMAPSTELQNINKFKTDISTYNEKRKKTRNNIYELPMIKKEE